MKKLPFAGLFALLCFALPLFAQRKPDWKLNIESPVSQIYLQNITGVPILQTEKAYFGIDPDNKKVAWKAERYTGKLKAFANALDTEGSDFEIVAGTPFVLIQGNVLESRTGAIIIGKEKDAYKYVADYELIPALQSVLIRTISEENMLRLYLVGLSDGAVKWSVNLMKMPKIEMTGLNEEPVEDRNDMPLNTTLVSPDKHLVFHYRKNLCVISPEGQLLWTTKCDPAEWMLSPDGQKIIVVNALVAGVGNSPVFVRYVQKYRSAKITAFDLKTGKESWKEDIKMNQNIRWVDAHPNFLAVVYGKGCNLFKYSTGQAIWADDFKGKRVAEIEPNEKGYLIHYESGYKTMQLSKSGKALWDKPKVLETDDSEDDDEEEGNLDVYTYEKGRVLIDAARVRFRPAKGAGMKRWKMRLGPDARVVYDDSLKNIVLLHDRQVYLINPDQNPAVFKAFKGDFQALPAFYSVEFRKNGYFLNSNQEYIFLDPVTGKLAHQYYKRPYDLAGAMLGMAAYSAGFQIASLHYDAAQHRRKAAQLQKPGASNTEIKKARHSETSAEALSFAYSFIPPARFEVFKSTRNYAYFFAKIQGENVLVKINKDGGAQADKLLFGGPRPIYLVDDVTQTVYFAEKGELQAFVD